MAGFLRDIGEPSKDENGINADVNLKFPKFAPMGTAAMEFPCQNPCRDGAGF
jgi:hypothetical protein